MELSYQDINSKTVDRWVEDGWEWGKPISHEAYENAKNGTWDVKLTPVKFVPHAWFGSLKGKRVLGLASGGGQQMPIFAALGRSARYWTIRSGSWIPRNWSRSGRAMTLPSSAPT